MKHLAEPIPSAMSCTTKLAQKALDERHAALYHLAQRQALAASRETATRTVTGGYPSQDHKLEEANLLHWYTKTYSKSERKMLASLAAKNGLAPMQDYVPPPEAAPKKEPPVIPGKKSLAKNSKTWQ